MDDSPNTNPFTLKRMVGLTIITGLMMAWIVWMTATYPTEAGLPKEEWARFNGIAVACFAIVVAIDVVAVVWTLKRRRQLPEAEKDFKGADPHLDRRVPVEAYTQSPLMQRAVARTLAKTGS